MEVRPNASNMYQSEGRKRHLERPGFHITELQLSSTQCIPWHAHSFVQDTFYVLNGRIKVSMRDPVEEKVLAVGETFTVAPTRPHRVTNEEQSSCTFLVLQGVGNFDFIPLETRISGGQDAKLDK